MLFLIYLFFFMLPNWFFVMIMSQLLAKDRRGPTESVVSNIHHYHVLQDYGLYKITNSVNETDLLHQLTLILDRIVLSYSVFFPKFSTLCIKFPNLFVKMPQVTIPFS